MTTTTTAFNFDSFTDGHMAQMLSEHDANPGQADTELDALYAEMIAAARIELRRRSLRTYRIIIENTARGEWVNDYQWEGTKAEFAASYNLTGQHRPHRATGTVDIAPGYRLHWGVIA